jgi:hypothetical protein
VYRVVRKVHLWVGLVLAVVLVVEAVTGLILSEPALFGVQKSPGRPPGLVQQQGHGLQRAGDASEGVYSLAKGLHQGRVGDLDLKLVIDLSGVGLALLTVTGVYMEAVCLRAGKRR